MFSTQTQSVTSNVGFLATLVILFLSTSAFASQKIGMVKTYQPHAYVVRLGVQQNLDIGAEIFQGDTIMTDTKGTVGIIFSDGAVLTLGPDGKLIIDKFLFNPSEQKVSFVSEVLKGTVAFISGAIGRISPDSVQFKTPTATLGLRGTKILIEVK